MPRRAAVPYQGDEKCEYCKIHKATHILVCGKLCCSSTAGNCKEARKRAGSKISISRNTEISPGITNAHLIAAKIASNKRFDIDENGNNSHTRSAKKTAKTKFEKINPITGLNVHQETRLKSMMWYTTDPGKIKRAELNLKVREIMNSIDPTTGLKEAKRRAKIMVNTKLSRIDEAGLNSFERAHWKGGKGGFVNGVYFQSSNEKRFLEFLRETGAIDNIKRGTKIAYTVNNEERTYLPDYIMGDNKLFEVKSKYTMFGQHDQFLENNIAKLSAAKAAGYIVYLVLDDKILLFDEFINKLNNS